MDKTKKLEPVPKPDEKLYRDRIKAETAAIDELRAKIVRRLSFSTGTHRVLQYFLLSFAMPA